VFVNFTSDHDYACCLILTYAPDASRPQLGGRSYSCLSSSDTSHL